MFRKVNPRWMILVIDLIICTFSVLLSFQLRFNFDVPQGTVENIKDAILLILAIRAFIFIVSKMYAGIIRYTGLRDIFKTLYINTIGSAIILTIVLVRTNLENGQYLIPMSVIAMDFFITVFFMIFFRVGVKVAYFELSHASVPRKNIIIYGSKELAVLAKRALELDPKNHYRIVAIISSLDHAWGKRIEGITVSSPDHLETLIHKHEIDQLIIASNKVRTTVDNSIVQICLNNHVKVFNIPNLSELISENLNINKIKELRIEDLLARDPIVLDKSGLNTSLYNKTIMITGAAGSIGSEIVRQVITLPVKQVILIDQAETPLHDLEIEFNTLSGRDLCKIYVADITSKDRMESLFRTYKPDVVYHAAAYKHVPMMERNPLEAVRNNVIGTKILADLASAWGVSKFIFISTDKAVNPTNIMGASKRIAEMYIQALNRESDTAFITTRFGNVLGSNGSVIPFFQRQIESRKPITVTHPEVTRFFMTIPEACQLVMEAGNFGKGGEIFVFEMGKPVKILDLAINMIKLAGLRPYEDIDIIFTGLRPGEKLYEELLHKAEDTISTHHPKIMIAKVREYSLNNIRSCIHSMEMAIHIQNDQLLVREMKKTVHEYISKNSRFEEIDKELKQINVNAV